MKNNILVVGYTYISDSQRETFNFYPDRDSVFFLVPDIWRSRRGKVVIRGTKSKNIFLTKTYFSHSNYPIVGGLLKGWMPAFPLVLLRLKWTHDIKLVYSCSEPALLTTFYNGFWTRIFGLKYVPYSWENISYDKRHKSKGGFLRKFILRLNMFLASGLISGNNKSSSIHRSYMGNKPIAIFPMNGLNQDFFKRQEGPKTFRGIDLANKTVFSYVGMIAKRKGPHLILDAFTNVLKELPSAYLIIAGSGEDDIEFQKQIERLNISTYIIRIPWVDRDELIKLLSSSDIFLYPSLPYRDWEEQFGYSMAEASLIGLPIISTRSGSIEDVVLDGKTGMLVEPDNADALCKAMICLGKNKELIRQFGDAGREYALANYTHKVIAKKFYNFFNLLLK